MAPTRRLRALRRPARFDAVLVVLVCGLGVEILACDVGVRVACDEEEVALVQILLVGVQRGLDGGITRAGDGARWQGPPMA